MTRNSTRFCLQPSVGVLLGIASIVVSNGMIGIRVELSASGVAHAIVRPAVSFILWNSFAFTITVTTTWLRPPRP